MCVYADEENLVSDGDAQKVNKAYIFIADDFNLVDEAETAEVVTELLFCQVFI